MKAAADGRHDSGVMIGYFYIEGSGATALTTDSSKYFIICCLNTHKTSFRDMLQCLGVTLRHSISLTMTEQVTVWAILDLPIIS